MQIGRADDRVHRLKRQVIFGRLPRKAVAVKALRRDTNDGDGFGVDPKSAANNGGVGGEILLPGLVTHDGADGRALLVIRINEEAARGGHEAEHAEVVTGDKGTHNGLGDSLRAFAAHGNRTPCVARLHGGQLVEFREVLFEEIIGLGGKE